MKSNQENQTQVHPVNILDDKRRLLAEHMGIIPEAIKQLTSIMKKKRKKRNYSR
jgi:hypothetical protein